MFGSKLGLGLRKRKNTDEIFVSREVNLPLGPKAKLRLMSLCVIFTDKFITCRYWIAVVFVLKDFPA